MKQYFFICLFLLSVAAGQAQQQADSVTICGRVTDYNGQPIDSCLIAWQSPSFSSIREAVTDRDGRYAICIPKGKYQGMMAINTATYPRMAKAGLPEADQRLEFWAWNLIADRDTTLDIRYHRMEVYGLRVFHIPGGMPAYQIYVRPMSLTRFQQKQKETKEESQLLAPPADKLKATVWIDGEEVPLLMKQEIKEHFSADKYGNAYLLTVGKPQHPQSELPYLIFKVELEDTENGDRGEGLYYMEKENYVQ